MIKLGINIDHVATLRNARDTHYPSVLNAAHKCIEAGASCIVMHLREDRRHIRDEDVVDVINTITVPLTLEMAPTEEMFGIAERLRPSAICLVPENRAELTTESGLDIIAQESYLAEKILRLSDLGIEVSIFIDPLIEQVDAAKRLGISTVELHTGEYCNFIEDNDERQIHFDKLAEVAKYTSLMEIECHAGHGINYNNVHNIKGIQEIVQLNIGHSIIAESIFVGLQNAVKSMLSLLA